MAKTKPTKKEAEELQKQIDEYKAKPVRANENRLKLNTTFDKAVSILAQSDKAA